MGTTFLSLLLLNGSTPAISQDLRHPTHPVGMASDAIILDGILNETSWQDAMALADFKTTVPLGDIFVVYNYNTIQNLNEAWQLNTGQLIIKARNNFRF